jgi:arginine decarboxylase
MTGNEYRLQQWGAGYFGVNAQGHIAVRPDRQGEGGDLFELVQDLVKQEIEAPILIRFNGIIRDRIQGLHEAFQGAIRAYRYRGEHRMVYPIKVNPQHHVVEVVLETGKRLDMGVEVGSKPELIAVLAHEASLLICNGYKDKAYIELALMASQLGKRTLIIIEQAYELKLVLDIAEALGVEAEIGFRMKLAKAGTGKWQASGGEQSKFGLYTYEIVASMETLKARGKSGWLKLLHFHMGSQITTIESIKKVLTEAARLYTEIAAEFPSLTYFDVGGGLAVDYDGTKSSADSSMNYTQEEYAHDIVSVIGEACLTAGIPDPTLITESGRAIVSHHSLLITEVIDVTVNLNETSSAPPSQHPLLAELIALDETVGLNNCRELFHDAVELKERALEAFIHGQLSLRERAFADHLYRRLCVKIRSLFQQLPERPEEIDQLDKILLETYFCNFSVFQSLPDSWAINQLFPIMPIHRLNERPDHRAVLADLSCDSDGKIDHFIGSKGFLPLHDYQEKAYYLAIFLVGAYQEILGDLHNLFGDTNVVHAEWSEKGEWELSRLVEGDTIEEVLRYVQYDSEKIKQQLYTQLERSLKAGKVTLAEAGQIKKNFKQALESYTYLVV